MRIEAVIDISDGSNEQYSIGEPIGSCDATVKEITKEGVVVLANPTSKKCRDCPCEVVCTAADCVE